MADSVSRYHGLIIALHWVMALAFFVMLASGFVMAYSGKLENSFKFELYQWHKSGGVILLMAATIRLLVRLLSRVPDLPSEFTSLERLAAKVGHWTLYGLMLLMPVTGWLMVSSSVYGLPTFVFGWFEWPHVPWVQGDVLVNDWAKILHFVFALVFVVLILVHVGAALKHWLCEGHNLLKRVWWR